MAFANITEARARVIDPTQEHSSSILYANDNFFTMGTIFYTNASKSVLAPAGNYVIPTNYKSYYVTLGSNGRMTTEPLEVMTGSMDTSWVDDTIHSGGVKIANYPWAYINGGGTAMVLDTASLLLTDTIWYTQTPEAGTYKAWQVDMNAYQSRSLENIDLSDMKGYEIKITCGNWLNSGRLWRGQPGVPGFQERTQTSAIVHIAADPNRVVTTGSLTYTFRPDYFIPSYNYEYTSFFRRLPDTLPIIDNSGSKKEFLDMGTPLGDLIYKSTGLGSLNRVRRISTRRNKCVTTLVKAGFAQYPYGAEYEETFANPNDRLQFDNDFFIRGAVGHIIGRDPNFSVESDTQKCAAMMESLVVDNDTWANGYSVYGVKYSEINPYHWTWEINSGTNGGAYSPANNLLGCYEENGNSRIREFDFEYFSGAGGSSYLCGLGFKKCIDACKVYAQANNYFAYTNENGFIPTFSNYAGGIYAPGWYGGWNDSDNARINQSLTQLRNGTLYYDYNAYYTSGSVDYTALGGRVTSFYVGAGDAINRHYITNYQNFGLDTWRAYQLVHSYDITKKLLFDIFGATVAGNARAMGYFWQFQEPIDASDFGFERIYVEWNGNKNGMYRPQPAPSTIQSQAVWSMAYADGSWCWEAYTQGEEPESIAYWQNYLGYDGTENQVFYKTIGAYGETRSRSNGTWDWLYIGFWQVLQHKDIIAASTVWIKAETYWNGEWLTGEKNYPVFLFYLKAPIVAYKLSDDGSEALMLVISPFNNGYTKETHRVRLPTEDNKEYLVDTWGNYTSVIRIRNISPPNQRTLTFFARVSGSVSPEYNNSKIYWSSNDIYADITSSYMTGSSVSSSTYVNMGSMKITSGSIISYYPTDATGSNLSARFGETNTGSFGCSPYTQSISDNTNLYITIQLDASGSYVNCTTGIYGSGVYYTLIG